MASTTHAHCANELCAIPTICDCDARMAKALAAQTERDGERHLQQAYAVLDRATVDAWLAAAGRFAQAPEAVVRAHVRLNDLVACTGTCDVCRPQCFACLCRYAVGTLCTCH